MHHTTPNITSKIANTLQSGSSVLQQWIKCDYVKVADFWHMLDVHAVKMEGMFFVKKVAGVHTSPSAVEGKNHHTKVKESLSAL